MRRLLLLTLIIISACSEIDNPKILFEQGKYKEAFILWESLASKGDSQAQNYIGIHYYLGLGKKRNYKIAKEWFARAAANGLPDAQYNLGVMYENGEFVKKNYLTAYMWFYLANQNGNSHASNRMQGMAEEHKLFPNQIKRAVELAKENFN